MKPKKITKINFDSGNPVKSDAKGAAIAKNKVTKNFGHFVFFTSHLLKTFMHHPRAKAKMRPVTV